MVRTVLAAFALALVMASAAYAADIPPACSALTEPGPDDPAVSTLRAYWDDAVSYLSAPQHLGRPLSVPTRIAACSTPNGDSSAQTVGIYSSGGALTRCAVVVYPRGLDELSDESLSRATMIHEAFHCFMDALLGRDHANSVKPWLNEGAAAWVGESALGGTDQSAYWWQSYLAAPRDPLFGRSYSAIGFFAHLSERGVDVWPQMDDLFRADSGAKATPLAMSADQYAFALAIASGDVLDSWPAGLARDASLGADFDTTGPGITADVYAQPGIDLGEALNVPESANDLVHVDLEGDIIRVVATRPSSHADGELRASDGSTFSLDSRDYCARDGGCTCQSGSHAAVAATLPVIATGDALLALSGHVPNQAVPDSGSSIVIRTMTLDAFCTEGTASAPPSPAGGGGVPTSASVNDAECGPWFGSGWFVSFTLGEPGGDSFWIVQVIVEPKAYKGPGSYPEETDASSYGARVSVTQGNGQGYAPLVTAPDGSDMGNVSIGPNGASGSAQVLLDNRRGGQIRTNYSWTCSTID